MVQEIECRAVPGLNEPVPDAAPSALGLDLLDQCTVSAGGCGAVERIGGRCPSGQYLGIASGTSIAPDWLGQLGREANRADLLANG